MTAATKLKRNERKRKKCAFNQARDNILVFYASFMTLSLILYSIVRQGSTIYIENM